MQIVIELEDDLYKRILDMKQPLFMNDLDSVYKAIVNGTPLYYKPITIREKDSEPRTLKALVDERTNEVYIRQFTLDYWESVKGCEVMTDEDSD